MKPLMRAIGRSSLKTAPLVFGGNIFGWTVDEQTSFQLLDAFFEAGFNLIDTANIYSNWVPGNAGGESEEIIGKWAKLRRCREKVLLATKVGMEMRGAQGLSKAHIFQSVEESLQRLQTDYIDLYYAHKDDTARSVEEPLEAFAQLIRQGKVRVITVTAPIDSATTLKRLHTLMEASRLSLDPESLAILDER